VITIPYMRNFLLTLFTVSFLFACKHKSVDNNTSHVREKTSTAKSKGRINGDSLGSNSHVEKDTVDDTIKILSKVVGKATPHPRFMLTGECVDGGITSKDTKYNWKGIFFHNKSCYIKDTRVTVKLMHETVDDENPNGNVMVATDNKDDCALLVANVPELISGPVKTVKLSGARIIPGKPQEFDFNGNSYTLYATGYIPDKEGIDFVRDYNLYIIGRAKGHYFKQLLVHNDSYESGFCTSIEFTGDVDGDGIPDFIINCSDYGIGGDWELFLSKPAGPEKLLVDVGGYSTAE
jgi:hypothetical protein